MKNQIVFFSKVLQGRLCYVLYTHYFNIITGLFVFKQITGISILYRNK